jgi:hypothetical protein
MSPSDTFLPYAAPPLHGEIKYVQTQSFGRVRYVESNPGKFFFFNAFLRFVEREREREFFFLIFKYVERSSG